MHIATLVCRFVAIPVVVAVLTTPVQAQQEAPQSEAFCALTGLDLLAALDGSWTIRQQAGTMSAGAMRMPLPAPAAATPVTFKFDAPRRIVDVRGANLGEEMAMFPSAPIQKEAADLLLGPAPYQPTLAPVCDWLESPTLIATNFYFFLGGEAVTLIKAAAVSGADCDSVERTMQLSDNALYQSESIGWLKDPEDYRRSLRKFWDMNCRQPPIVPEQLDMEMTLVLRFTSRSSGSGMVYFSGQTDRSRFAASAPVTISR